MSMARGFIDPRWLPSRFLVVQKSDDSHLLSGNPFLMERVRSGVYPTITTVRVSTRENIIPSNNRSYFHDVIEKRKLGAYAMKRVAAGAHLSTHWLLSLRNAQTIEPTTDWIAVHCR